MSRRYKIAVSIVCLILVATDITLWTINWKQLKVDNYKESIHHLNEMKDSINHITDSIKFESHKMELQRDSLKNKLENSDTIIKIIEQAYEKDFVDITNQSIADDSKFFSNYLSQDSTRFINSNNTSTIKTY